MSSSLAPGRNRTGSPLCKHEASSRSTYISVVTAAAPTTLRIRYGDWYVSRDARSQLEAGGERREEPDAPDLENGGRHVDEAHDAAGDDARVRVESDEAPLADAQARAGAKRASRPDPV